MSSEDEFDTELCTGFEYSVNLDSLKQGAEAKLVESTYLGRNAVIKERFKKKYRNPILDEQLNKLRTRNELKGIVKARELGVATPAVYFIDGEKNLIIMERVNGPTAKEWIESKRICGGGFEKEVLLFGEKLGSSIAKIHSGGLVHGDLTTSNVLLRDSNFDNLVLIDFGLCAQGKVTPEDKAVDLYVLERAIMSTHIDCDALIESIMNGYKNLSPKQGGVVMKKLDEVRLRGRKRDMIG